MYLVSQLFRVLEYIALQVMKCAKYASRTYEQPVKIQSEYEYDIWLQEIKICIWKFGIQQGRRWATRSL